MVPSKYISYFKQKDFEQHSVEYKNYNYDLFFVQTYTNKHE